MAIILEILFFLLAFAIMAIVAVTVTISIVCEGVVVSQKHLIDQKFILRSKLITGGLILVILDFLSINIMSYFETGIANFIQDTGFLTAILVCSMFLAPYTCCAIYQTITRLIEGINKKFMLAASIFAGLGITFLCGPAYLIWKSHTLQWCALGGLTALLLVLNYLLFNKDYIVKIWQQFLIKRKANARFEIVISEKNTDMIPYHFDKNYLPLLNVLKLRGRKYSRFEIQKRSSDMLFRYRNNHIGTNLIECITQTLLEKIPS